MSIPSEVTLRTTADNTQGGRKYMEDKITIAYHVTEWKHLEYAYFGIFDGHGGEEASIFARENLLNSIVKQNLFWSINDEDVLRAIREGYIATHLAMWKEQGKFYFIFSN